MMVSYYTTLLLLTLLLQTNRRDALKTIITLLIVCTSTFIMDYYTSNGYSIFQSAVRCELVYLILIIATVTIHKSKMLFVVTITSLVWNILCVVPTTVFIQNFIYTFYQPLNIILFECLLYSCMNTTRPSVFVKKYLNDIKDRQSRQEKVIGELC